MKQLIFIFLIGIIPSNLLAQRHGIYVGLGPEFTVGGNFGNAHIGVELNRHLIGFSYGKKIRFSDNQFSPKSEYVGVHYQFTFLRETHIQLGGLLQARVFDGQFFTYLPSFMFDYIFNDYFKFNISLGVRGEYPSYAVNLVFNLPLKKNEFPNPIF